MRTGTLVSFLVMAVEVFYLSLMKKAFGIIDSVLKADGSEKEYLNQKLGGSAHPITKDNVGHPDMYVYQEGSSVFKFAVTSMADVSAEIMERNNLTGRRCRLVGSTSSQFKNYRCNCKQNGTHQR